MLLKLSTEMVAQVIESVFGTMLDLDVTLDDAPWAPVGDRLTSAVYLEGKWNGAVLLECDHQQACQFTGKLLSMDPPEEVDDDVRDVLGELANMIGGNIKSIVSPDDRLSLPSVIDGNNYEVRVCGSDSKRRTTFRYSGGIFGVTIVGKDLPAVEA
jgi:chemotaxis protein CheX